MVRRNILVASAALIVLLNDTEVVGCQIGHRDMEVVASLSKATKREEVAPSYEFWLPLIGGCGLYYHDSPYRIEGNLGADLVKGSSGADAMYGGLGNDKVGTVPTSFLAPCLRPPKHRPEQTGPSREQRDPRILRGK